jgi:hypothetical protein
MDNHRTRTPNPETLTLRSAASTTTLVGGDLAAGRSPHLSPRPNLAGGQTKRARPTLSRWPGKKEIVRLTNLKHRKVGGLPTFRKVYRICRHPVTEFYSVYKKA